MHLWRFTAKMLNEFHVLKDRTSDVQCIHGVFVITALKS